MSQLDDAPQRYILEERSASVQTHPDWTVLVIVLAFGCTLAWACLWLWLIVRSLQVAFS